MVGVPGRSKACRTCKKRRKGCDEKRPSCGQCTLSRVPCGGYDQPRIFINSGKEHKHTKGATCRFEAATYSVAHSSSSLPSRDQPFHVSARTRAVALSDLAQPVTLHRSLDRTARQSRYLEVFWTLLLPHGKSFPARAAQYSTTNWTEAVQDLHCRDPLVRVALLANALGLAGQRNGQPSLVVQGRRLYGLSLQAVARSLTTNRQDWGGILAASGLLATYELLLTADEQGSWLPAPTWLRHTSGEMAILLAGGPGRFVNGFAHQLFADHRLHLIYSHIYTRTRCPLSILEWKTIPWSTRPKSPKDELVDILIEIPGILEDVDVLELLSNQPERQTLLRQDLEERCWLYDRQLQLWSTSSGAGTVAFVEDLLTAQNQCDNSLAPSSNNLAIAHLGMIYWSTYNILSQIVSSLRKTGTSEAENITLPLRLDPYQYCHKIELLIPYFQKPGVGFYFISFVGFPVTVTASFLAGQDLSGVYTEAKGLLLKAFHGEHGAYLQRFLATWPWKTNHELQMMS